MNQPRASCPLSKKEVLDMYFLEHRAKLLDVAAFLDRIDRARDADAPADYRAEAFRKALHCLAGSTSERVRAVLDVLSDPTDELLQDASGMKGAGGAWNPDGDKEG